MLLEALPLQADKLRELLGYPTKQDFDALDQRCRCLKYLRLAPICIPLGQRLTLILVGELGHDVAPDYPAPAVSVLRAVGKERDPLLHKLTRYPQLRGNLRYGEGGTAAAPARKRSAVSRQRSAEDRQLAQPDATEQRAWAVARAIGRLPGIHEAPWFLG